MTGFTFTFLGGTRLGNIETLGAVSSKTWTVPSNKRWLIIGGYVERDANATLTGVITDTNDKNALPLFDDISAGTTNIFFPRDAFFPTPCIVDDGDKVVVTWGAAQTSPEVALWVLEIDT